MGGGGGVVDAAAGGVRPSLRGRQEHGRDSRSDRIKGGYGEDPPLPRGSRRAGEDEEFTEWRWAMKHLDEEQFAAWASGERNDEMSQHLRECAECLAEVRELN